MNIPYTEIIVAYTTKGEPLTKKEYNQRLVQAEKQIESGKVISQEDLEKKITTWKD